MGKVWLQLFWRWFLGNFRDISSNFINCILFNSSWTKFAVDKITRCNNFDRLFEEDILLLTLAVVTAWVEEE